ncbi:MAG: hypothetical protein ABL993_00930 [Vicinamibacterales bacterium]
MADYNLANWARNAPPEQVTAELLRQKILSARQQALAQANEQAGQYDPLVSVAALSNNPDIMTAAQGMQKSQRARFEPEKLGTQGFMLPETGEFVPSTIYEEEKQAQRAAQRTARQERLDAQRERQDERLQQADALRQQQFALTGALAAAQRDQRASEGEANRALRRAIAEMSAGRVAERREVDQAAKDEKELNRLVITLDKTVQTRAIPRLMTAGKTVADAIVEAEKNKVPVPGFTIADKLKSKYLPFLTDDAAARNISAVQEITNALLKADSGLNVTQMEQVRKAQEQMQSDNVPEARKRQILKERILPLLNIYRSTALGAFPAHVRTAYASRQQEVGGDTTWMDQPLQFDQLAPDTAPGEKVIGKRVK